MKRIIYTRPNDGGLSVIHPAPQAQLPDETEDDFIQRIFAKDIPADAINSQIIEESEIPEDRTFRNAWVAGIGKIEHDMDKCREIQKNKMREHRKPLMDALDVDFMKALEDGDVITQAKIKDQKKQLRDITEIPSIMSAKTPDELKKVWPFGEKV